MCTLEAKAGRILENRSVDNEVSNQCLRLDVLFKLGLILFGQMTIKFSNTSGLSALHQFAQCHSYIILINTASTRLLLSLIPFLLIIFFI